jgi:hypothetical protein
MTRRERITPWRIWQSIVSRSVRVLVLGLCQPGVEDGREIRLHDAETQPHALVRFAEGHGGLGFQEFVVGVNLDHDVLARRQGIGRLHVTASGAEVANFRFEAQVFLLIDNFCDGGKRIARRATSFVLRHGLPRRKGEAMVPEDAESGSRNARECGVGVNQSRIARLDTWEEFTTEVAASAEFEEQKQSCRVDADVLDEGEMGE